MQNFRALGAPPPDPHNSPPHCEFMATRLDHTKSMFYTFVLGLHQILGKKIGLILSEDLFFCSSPNFGQKIGLNLSGTISYSDLCSSQIF